MSPLQPSSFLKGASFFLLLIHQHTLASPLHQPLHIVSDAFPLPSVSATPLPKTSSRSLALPTTHCGSDPSWLPAGSSLDEEECGPVLRRLYIEKVLYDGDTQHEFFTRDHGNPKTRLQPETLPQLRYWTQRQCVLAVAMLNQFSPSQLPGAPTRQGSSNEISTWRQIAAAAGAVYTGCAGAQGQPGWASAGNRESIGVFLLVRGSEIHRALVDNLSGNTTWAKYTGPALETS
ncbi:MAG: hypothetical protein Q9217_006629 [Psora testacea]